MIFYVDGSAAPNPGPGGFGVVQYNDNNKIVNWYAEYKDNTTNNEMELSAILYVYENYGVNIYEDFQVNIPIVYSDSSYAINCCNEWMFSWQRRGWLTSSNKKPENFDIIKRIYSLYRKGIRIDLNKVRGHSGIEGNEIADKLATKRLPQKYHIYLLEQFTKTWKPQFAQYKGDELLKFYQLNKDKIVEELSEYYNAYHLNNLNEYMSHMPNIKDILGPGDF